MAFPRLAARAIALMPEALLSKIAGDVFGAVLAAHPAIVDRLGDHAARRFDFVAADMDLRFRISPARRSIRLYRGAGSLPPEGEADAAVEGPLHLLLLLAEGGADADALFFSRDLAVTGDMEALLALRNALDDGRIDIPASLSGLAGPFGGLAERLARHVRHRVTGRETPAWN